MASKFFNAIKARFFSSPSDTAVDIGVDGDSNARVSIDAGGRITWGSGSAAGDVNLYRDTADVLKTDDTLKAAALFVDSIEVDTTGATLNDLLKFDGTKFAPSATAGGIEFLYDLSDVTITSPVNGALLQYNGTEWVDAVLPTSEPLGHENKADSVISFDNGTRTFSIAPASSSYTVWCKGVRYVKTGTETVTIGTTTGLYYIYFNSSGVLSYRTTYFDWENDTPTAYIYWNATTSKAEFFADERHGVVLDWQTHEYLHRTRGAALANGFGASGYTTTGDGSSDTHTQIALAGGTFFDEDLQVDITHSASPTANTWQQVLEGAASIPVFYLNGSAWEKTTASTVGPFKTGTARAQYNYYNGSTWSTEDVQNNKYGCMWIVATNNLNEPVVAILGQTQADNQSTIEERQWENLVLDNFPIFEFRPLYRIAFVVADNFTNTYNAAIRQVTDIRSVLSAGGGIPSVPVSDHGSMTGLGDDDHTQYLTNERHDALDHSTAMSSVVFNDISDINAGSPSSGDFLKWNGSAWVNDPIDLGTDTAGNYVADVLGGTGVTVTHTPGEGSSPSVAIGQAVETTSDVTFNTVTLSASPTNSNHAVTKSYVDNVAAGIDWHQAVRLTTAAALPDTPVFSNGTGGVGATLTATSYARLSVDGTNATTGDRVLVKNQGTDTHNGVYVVTEQGNAVDTYWVLTRATDFDGSPTNEIKTGEAVFTTAGAVNANQGFVLTSVGSGTDGAHTLNTDSLTFTQFTGTQAFTAGDGLTQSGNTINAVGNAGRIVVNADDIDLDTVSSTTSAGSDTTSFVSDITVDSYGRVTNKETSTVDLTSTIQKSIITATGDLVVGASSGTPAILSVGTDGYVLKANASATNGVEWAVPGSTVTISDTAPSSPSTGDLWWESDTGRLKIYYTDTDSSQWVDAYTSVVGAGGSDVTLTGLQTFTNKTIDLADNTVTGTLAEFNTAVSDADLLSTNIVDAKGDLLVGTADDTIDNLPVGPNGYVLEADSGEPSGLKWSDRKSVGLNAQTGTTYTLELDDAGKVITATNASPVTVTVPTNSGLGLDSFNPNFNNTIQSVVVQSDDKILAGGGFTSVGGTTRNYIARLNSDGTLDTGFDPDVDGAIVFSVAIQPDGKILIGGFFWTIGGTTRNNIARLNSDGTLDTGFGDPNADEQVNSIVVQPDGKILVGGLYTSIGGATRNYIARLNSDGTLDTGFNPNANDEVTSIVLRSDGKILIGGFFTTIGGTTRNRVALLNSDGTLDTGFGDPNVNGTVMSVALQSDGKILIGGDFTSVGGTGRNYIARLNSDGTLDTGFAYSASNSLYDIVVQPDDKILIGGNPTSGIRLNSDGTLDTSFDFNAGGGAGAFALQSDGKILVGGFFTSIEGVTRNYMARVEEVGRNFPIGTQIVVIAGGAGAVTFSPESGVTINSKDNDRTIDGQYASACCLKTATDTWILFGALTT